MIVITTLIVTMPTLPLLIPQNIMRKVPLSHNGYVISYGTFGAISANIIAVANAVNALYVSAAKRQGFSVQSRLIHSIVVLRKFIATHQSI